VRSAMRRLTGGFGTPSVQQSHRRTRMPRAFARLILAAGLGGALAACMYQPVPILMQGAPQDRAALGGRWHGEYYSTHSGRSGTITIDVHPGKDTAFGEVMMDAGPNQPLLAEDARWAAHIGHASSSELLRITFVSVFRTTVEGVLEPYIAPDCKCVVRTTFTGRIRGDSITGEFLTTGEYWLRQTGKWTVRRMHVATR
jgi:hypothetical protein